MKAFFLTLVLALTIQAQNLNQCKDSSDKAIVYFYRVKESNALRKGQTKLTINDLKEIFQMPKGSYIGFYLTPGKFELIMGSHKETAFLLNAEAGREYFFRVSNTAAGDSQLRILAPMKQEQAIYQMRDLKPLSNDNVKSTQMERCDRP